MLERFISTVLCSVTAFRYWEKRFSVQVYKVPTKSFWFIFDALFHLWATPPNLSDFSRNFLARCQLKPNERAHSQKCQSNDLCRLTRFHSECSQFDLITVGLVLSCFPVWFMWFRLQLTLVICWFCWSFPVLSWSLLFSCPFLCLSSRFMMTDVPVLRSWTIQTQYNLEQIYCHRRG